MLCLTTAAIAQEFGLASFYSDEFQGSTTAYGFTYDKNELTCAHKKHPPGTILRVTRLDNKKSIDVKVIDQGPFIKGRIVDLSRRAAERIDLIDDGVIRVKVEVLKLGATREESKVVETRPKKEPKAIPKQTPPSYDQPEPVKTEKTETAQAEKKQEATVPPVTQPQQRKPVNSRQALQPPPDRSRLVGNEFQDFGLYQIMILNTAKGGYGVQVASLVNYPNVFRQVADLQAKGFDNVLVSIEKGELDKPVYKIILGSFDNEDSAQRYRSDLQRRYKIKGFVVNLAEMAY